MNSIAIATIEAVANGWLVTTNPGSMFSKTTLHTEWKDVEAAVRAYAGWKNTDGTIEWRKP